MLADWALSLVISRLFATKPRILKQRGTLVIFSGWRSQLFTLGTVRKKVVVDPTQRIVRIQTRLFWLFTKSRLVMFERIHEVLCGYADLSVGAGFPMSAYQEQDLFSVGLVLDRGEHVVLFRFFGEGSFVNNTAWPDWCYWDNFAFSKLTQGNQETESLLFAELLAQMIGVPIGNPI